MRAAADDERGVGGWGGGGENKVKPNLVTDMSPYTNMAFCFQRREFNMFVLTESEQQLQHMIDKLDATCQQYGMVMNAKKTKQ